MSGLVDQIQGSLERGRVVSIQGSSGVGKSETLKLLQCLLQRQGRRVAYVDMRFIRGINRLCEEIGNALDPQNGADVTNILEELKKGDIALLLDEYWAGSQIGHSIVQQAHRSGNYVVTAAGNPIGVPLDEYLKQGH